MSRRRRDVDDRRLHRILDELEASLKATGRASKHVEQSIFEAVMEGYYGPNIWEWWNREDRD